MRTINFFDQYFRSLLASLSKPRKKVEQNDGQSPMDQPDCLGQLEKQFQKCGHLWCTMYNSPFRRDLTVDSFSKRWFMWKARVRSSGPPGDSTMVRLLYCTVQLTEAAPTGQVCTLQRHQPVLLSPWSVSPESSWWEEGLLTFSKPEMAWF